MALLLSEISRLVYHYDGLWSVTNVPNANGTPQWSYSYDPFGNSRSATKINPLAPDNPMRFTGEYLDPTGLYHLRARQYDASLGRFTASDPLSPQMKDPYVSTYGYVNNRPTVLTDPWGLSPALSLNSLVPSPSPQTSPIPASELATMRAVCIGGTLFLGGEVLNGLAEAEVGLAAAGATIATAGVALLAGIIAGGMIWMVAEGCD